MPGTFIFDFTTRSVSFLTPDGKRRPASKPVKLVGSPVPPAPAGR